MRKRSVDAKFARNMFVGDLNAFLFKTVSMMRTLPITLRLKVNLRIS